MSLVEFGEIAASFGHRYYGKYKGEVVNNIDPNRLGRIQVKVPAVSGRSTTSWALPCLPWGGIRCGLFTVPPIGATCWIEFEAGDPDLPIWTGCFWEAGDVPAKATALPSSIPGLTIETPLGHVLQISDLPGANGGIQLQTPTGSKIQITATKLLITNGIASIELSGPQVRINGDALTIT